MHADNGIGYQYAARQMIKQGRGGRIVGACSLSGKQGVRVASTLLLIFNYILLGM